MAPRALTPEQEKRSIANKKYREANREKLRLQSREYYYKNREKLLVDHNSHYRIHRREILKKLRDEYPTRREYSRAYCKQQRSKLRRCVFALIGEKCACCGESEFNFLEVDHIHGGGNKHFTEKGTWGVLREVRDHPERSTLYRTLCSNCNKARSRLGYCPHGNGI